MTRRVPATGRALFMVALLISAFAAAAEQSSPAAAKVDAEPSQDEDPRRIVARAFDRMFNYPSVRTVQMNIHRHGRGTSRRSFEVAYKRISERGHSLLRFVEPEYLRGNAVLMLERENGSTDTFLYLDSERRTRRVTTAQKADAFYGSDVTFEDLEHHDWSQFQLSRLQDELEQGRESWVLQAIPSSDSQYSQLTLWIEKERHALLRLDFHRGPSKRRVKTLFIDPSEIREERGVLKPERMLFRQMGRDAETELRFLRIESDPEITESVFTSMRLERSRTSLYELVQRLKDPSQDLP